MNYANKSAHDIGRLQCDPFGVRLKDFSFFKDRGKICFVKDSVQGWKAVGRQLDDYKEKRSRYENLLVSFDVHYAEMYRYTLSEFTSF